MSKNENIIDQPIGELAKRYDLIFAANTNLARMSTDLIDGLKTVQRRILYVMYLKDQGKNYRKVESISGDVLGMAHPHGSTAITDALVNMAQWWKSDIPLVDGFGNFGTCHDAETEVLTRHGWKLFKDVNDDDLLASANPEDGYVIFEKPVRLISYHYEGELIVGDHDELNFAVTPDHKMVIIDDQNNPVFVDAKNLPSHSSLVIPILDPAFRGGKRVELRAYAQRIMHTAFEIDRDRDIHREHYEGMVYCAEVPTYHTLVTRRHGKILVSGNCSGDPAGASRYITARLSEYARACFFEDWKDSVVDMEMSYNEETLLPKYLPAKYPNVLINGCNGIGHAGYSFSIPCFNFREVVESTILLMANPEANIILIPDSPTGADIIDTDFNKLCERGNGAYMQRCKYNVDPDKNMITITALPMLSTANAIREKIADLKEHNSLPELVAMHDLSGEQINIQLVVRDDVNPYKFMRKLIKEIPGLERTYPVNVTVAYEMKMVEYSIKDLLLEWINWRREQKRVVISNKRTTLMADQRINEVKLFIMSPANLDKTIHIYRSGRNRAEIEAELVRTYKNTEIRMDSLQARALSNMRMVDLCAEAYEECKQRAKELEQELAETEAILDKPDGIDKVIVAELRDGVKRFGKPRRSNVVPYKISVSNEQDGVCTLQLSSDGTILRRVATNADEEPIPTDSNGFACLVDNDSSFILVDDSGQHTFIRVRELPIDAEVPVWRYAKRTLSGSIVAMLPVDINSDRCCTLISKKGMVKRVRISEIGPSKKPLMSLDKDDSIVRGIVMSTGSSRELLIYTKEGYGQRIDPNSIRITSPLAKGSNGFKLGPNDEIVGCYAISPESNDYLLYISSKGKGRLNRIEYLPVRNSKNDSMVRLINLNDRDKLVAVVGCNRYDKCQCFYDDGTSETIDISKMNESTMGTDPKKVTAKNAVSNNVVKVRLC